MNEITVNIKGVGLVTVPVVEIETGPLQEYEQERWAHEYLNALQGHIKTGIKERVKP